MSQELFWWHPLWFFPTVMPIVMIIVMAAVLFRLWGRGGSGMPCAPDGGKEPETALEILKKRYARGEITREEFAHMRREIS